MTIPSNVSVRGIDIAFGNVKVFKKLDIEVRQSEFVVLLGPSGCGKSTLLNAIAGLQEVDEGQIWIGDKNVTWHEPKDRGIAMVFQSYALYPRMTVRQNMSFGLKVAGTPKAEIERRVKIAADMLRLDKFLDRRPSELSGGQRQRVAIGRALVRDVGVFLFDEPLSNLDAQLRAELRVEIKRLHSRLNATMIYVTHDQIEALTLADRIAIMKEGVVQQFDTSEGVYRRPVNKFVASFIGSPAMNFFHGRLNGADGKPAFEGQGFHAPLTGYNFDAKTESGTAAVLGVRPEHIVVGQPGSGGLDAAVELVEPMGSDSLVWCRLGTMPFSVMMDSGRKISAGERLSVTFPAEQVHLFDDATDARL